MANNIKLGRPRMPYMPGIKLSTRNSQALTSTGIPSLDHFLGGGLPIGSILLVEEDAYNTYAKVILKYFIAEGVVNTHSIFIASQDASPSQIISELPAVEEEITKAMDDLPKEEEMKIAWRYQNMKVVDSSPSSNSTLGHYYDLTKKMKAETLAKSKIRQWDGEDSNCKDQNIFDNSAYMDLLLDIKKTIDEGNHSVHTDGKKNALRIAINSLGSRLWISDTEENSHKDLLKFLYMLRPLLRESYSIAIVTVPSLNFDDHSTGIVQRIEHLTDAVIALESFAGSPKETNPMFKDYHGLLHLKKLPTFNTLVNPESLSSDLAFKLRRKKFLIEILHLPPELGETSQREQDDGSCNTSGSCCGTSTGHKLDF